MKNNRPYQICTRCILSTDDDAFISFDEHGVCNHCHLFDEEFAKRILPEEERRKKLNELITEIKQAGKGKKYDCIIGVSGGVDSTYVAYLVKEVFGLRPLAVHLDNGWNSELSVSNISSIIKTLDIDLFTHVINWQEFRDVQLAYLKASVIDLETTTDNAIMGILYKTARKHVIKYILNGENFVTEGILPASWIHNKLDSRNLKAIHRKFGTRKKLKTFPTISLYKKYFYEKVLGIESIQILNYVDYSNEEARRTIIEKLHWREYGDKHHESIITRFFQTYILPVKFGVDKRRAHLSTLICSGQITREDALIKISRPPHEQQYFQSDKEFVLKKFGLSNQEFEEIMARPVVSHLAYPSVLKTLATIRPITRLVKKMIYSEEIKNKKNKKRKRVAMLLDNSFVNDNRVFLEAKTIAEHFDLTVYAVRDTQLPIKEIADGIKIHRIFPDSIFKIQEQKLINNLARRIAKEKYDVIHAHDHLMLNVGAKVKRLNPDTTLIYDSHELFHSWPINYASTSLSIRIKSYLVRKIQILLEKKSGKHIDYLITVNQSLADVLSKYFKLKESPLVVRNLLPYEVVDNGKHILRKKFNIPEENKILVFIGWHVYPKTLNIEAVIDQIGNKRKISFVLICNRDVYRKAVEDYAKSKGYSNIFFHDIVKPSEITSYLTDCDVGIISTWNKNDLSYWYALDNKLFNYLMAEIPILATAQPEYKSIIEKYGIGVCVNPDEPGAFINGFNHILQNDEAFRINITETKKILNWENESKKLIQQYDSLLLRSTESAEDKIEGFIKPQVVMLLDNQFVMDKRVLREAKALVQAGFPVTLYAVKDASLPSEEVIEGILVKRIFDTGIFDIKKINNRQHIAEKLSKEKIDILHCHDWTMLNIGSRIKKINSQIVLIYDSHELFYSWPLNYSNRNSLWIQLKSIIVRKLEIFREKKCATSIDHLITVSASFGERLKQHFHYNKEPVIVKNIAEYEDVPAQSNYLRQRFNIPATTKIIVNFSLNIYLKSRNLEEVIDQIANVEGVALVIISKEGGNKKEIIQMVKDRNIKNIFFHEAIYDKDIMRVLSSADIGLVSTWNKKQLSYWFGLENKVFQYIIAELPILATAQPEHLQVIEKYNLGVCVNADEDNAYLKGYYDIVNQYDEYKKNITKTRKFLHWDNEKIKLLQLYHSIENELNGTKG